jgi:cytidylate kinase
VQQLLKDQAVSHQPNVLEMAQLVLALGAHGNVILLGRGAGYLLPRRSTLHVRFVAPLTDRVAYMGQWLRMTDEEAAEQVRKRDHRRTEYLATHFHRKPNDVHLFDMVLNTSLLGEERCADIVAAAAKAKMSAIVGME